jgi:hypothetical protein
VANQRSGIEADAQDGNNHECDNSFSLHLTKLVILCRISFPIPGTCLLASYGNLSAENVEDVTLLHCKRSAAGYALRNGPVVRAKETWGCALLAVSYFFPRKKHV